MLKTYADIIIDISHEAIDRAFQYEVPTSLCNDITAGMEVLVPFGNGNKLRKGYVVSIGHEPKWDESKIKQISSINDQSIMIESQLIKLAAYIKENYGSTMINALKTVLPIKDKIKRVEKKYVKLNIESEDIDKVIKRFTKSNSKAKLRLLKELIEENIIPYDLVTGKLNISKSTLDAMIKDEVIEILSEQVYRMPADYGVEKDHNYIFTSEQQVILEEFNRDYDAGIRKTYLLHGVTGSGKTLVYIETIRKVISEGKQAIVLIPEIALTYQMVKRFRKAFGDRITIINSKQSKGEKYDQFLRVKNSEVDVVIGPRSALFAPFNNLGLIVIDEEHESSYKSDSPPKYHARQVAIMRSNMCGASVILGSATPSVESYYKAMNGEYRLWTMKNRTGEAKLSTVSIVDLREELRRGNKSIISEDLKTLIANRLIKKEQTMLFINKRGYEGFISCRSCGQVIKCPHCDVSLTYHNNNRLTCHYCGYTIPMVKTCPQCGSPYIGGFGTGTEKVEETIKKMFPEAKVLRMDGDTTRLKGGLEKILSQFENGEADILVGTQMIVKGHDFSRVSLVGVLAADLSLHSNDYMANERTFDLLTQAAGRAGRGSIEGYVVIQTYLPDHYAVTLSAKQDYESFYKQEMEYRKMLKYPPVYNMLVILMTSKKEDELITASIDLTNYTKKLYDKLYVIGPSEATIGKINDIYRRVVYIKDIDYNRLVDIKNHIDEFIENNDMYKRVTIHFDFNPMNIY